MSTYENLSENKENNLFKGVNILFLSLLFILVVGIPVSFFIRCDICYLFQKKYFHLVLSVVVLFEFIRLCASSDYRKRRWQDFKNLFSKRRLEGRRLLFAFFCGILLSISVICIDSMFPSLSDTTRGGFIEAIVLAPIIEEFVYRSLILGVLFELYNKERRIWKNIFFIVISSVMFAWMHYPGWSISRVIVIGIPGGLVFGYLYLLGNRKDLKLSWIAHLTANIFG